MCLLPVYMNNIQPSDVFSPPLLVEIFAWVGVWEVRWRDDMIRTDVYGFDAALPLTGRHK